MTDPQFHHEPVLATEAARLLAPTAGKILIDATIGGGGHAEALLKKIVPGGFLIGIDRDEEAVRAAEVRLAPQLRENVLVVRGDFASVVKVAARMRFDAVDGILADLGVSSHQLDVSERGFSFLRPGPLDMRFSKTQRDTAADIVNTWGERDLAELIRDLGEDRFARRIARFIVEARPIRTTDELSRAVEAAIPPRFRERHKHPATRTFQALRIAVNEEIERLHALLEEAPKLLRPGSGVFCVISYHSLEDRPVKHAFRELVRGGKFESLTRKPVVPSDAEVARNPRSRSAKLRAIRRSAQ